MNEIEQLKRDLKSYGYYQQYLKELDIKIYSLNHKIETLELRGGAKFTGKVYTYQCIKCGEYEFLTDTGLKNRICCHCDGDLKEIKDHKDIIKPSNEIVAISQGEGTLIDSLNATLQTLLDLQEETEIKLSLLGLDDALNKLTNEQRIIIEKHYFHGVCYEHIGMMLNRSKTGVVKIGKKSLRIIYETCKRVSTDT